MLPPLRTRPAPLGAVLASVLATLLALLGTVLLVPAATAAEADAGPSASSSSARTVEPREDYARLPARCLDDSVVPERPLACRLVWHGRQRPTLVLWGDSHAWHQVPALRRAVSGRRVNLVAFLMGACPPVLVAAREREPVRCEVLNRLALAEVTRLQAAGRRPTVVLGSAWGAYRDRWRAYLRSGEEPVDEVEAFRLDMAELAVERGPQLFRALGRRGIDVDVVAQGVTVPASAAPCPAGRLPYSCSFPRAAGLPHEAQHRRWLRSQMSHLAGSPRLIDVNGAVCGARRCRGVVDGVHTFWDDFHFSASRSQLFAPFFRTTVRELAGRR